MDSAGPVQRQRRNDRIHTRSVRQARIHHRRRLVHSASDARNDAVDDLQQVTIVAERRVRPRQEGPFFNEHVVLVVDQDVGDLLVLEQGLKRTEAEDFIQQIRLDLLLLIEAQRNPAVADDLVDDARNRLAAPGWS